MIEHWSQFKPVREYQNVDKYYFQQIIQNDQPAILKGALRGTSIGDWDLDFLNQRLAAETIVIHESDCPHLEFLARNFKYRTCQFSEFVELLKDPSSKAYYYRSISKDVRKKKPARIEEDLPFLETAFRPPEYIPFGKENPHYFSSVMRIASSNVQIWTHFDLYDNVLFQIVGKKRVVLFQPKDTEHLHVDGDKSPVNNFDNWDESIEKYPSLRHTSPFVCHLDTGDGLFIPSLWWHNVKTSDICDNSHGHSIGFNVFWRDPSLLEREFYATGDVYGNKNLTPFDAALSNLDKAINHIERLPGKYKPFYKTMLLMKLKNRLTCN